MKTLKSCFAALALLCCTFGYARQALVDSLETALRTSLAPGRALFYQYIHLINAANRVDPSQTLEYSREAIEAARRQDDIYWVAEFYYMTGDAFFRMRRLDSASVYYDRSEELRQEAVRLGKEDKAENDYLTIRLFVCKGKIDMVYGNFDSALDNYFSALTVAERIDDADEIAEIYSYMANAYYQMSNPEQAERYYLKMERLSQEQGNSARVAEAYLGLSMTRNARGDTEGALRYAEDGYRILLSEPALHPVLLIEICMRLAEAWMEVPDYDKAFEYARESIRYAGQIKRPNFLASALYTLSSVYLEQGNNAQSEQTAFEALAADSTDLYVKAVLYGNIAQANIRMGKSEKGIEYFGKTLNAHRALSNRNFQASLSEMEVRYETEKKETRIAALEDEKRLMMWLTVAGGVAALLVLAALSFLWRLTVQKKRQLEQEKQLIATRATLDGEVRERARLARDLHDGLGSVLTGAKMGFLDMKRNAALAPIDMERFDRALGLLDGAMHEMRHVAHHLMPDSLSRFGLKHAVGDFCSNLPSVEFVYYGDGVRLEPNLEVMIYRSIYELVNNALKHARASQIIVQIMHRPGSIAFTVQDDGVGFDPSSIETAGPKGIGLANIRTRVASHGGVLNIDSKTGEGTEINIEIEL